MEVKQPEDPLKKSKELLKTIAPTLESIVATSDNFLLMSLKGHTEDLIKLWQKMFNLATSSQKLSYLYLMNHIVQTDYKDEGRLKSRFFEIIEKSFEIAYKLSDSLETKNDIIGILKIWKERNIFDSKFLEKVENTLTSGNLIEKTKKPANIPTTMFEALKKIIPPKHLIELAENLKRINEWDEKIELIKENLQTILAQKVEYNEIDAVCKLAEFERAINQRKKVAQTIHDQIVKLIQKEDNLHMQEVLQIKIIDNLLGDVKKIRDKINNPNQY